jgi:hypothetical protein
MSASTPIGPSTPRAIQIEKTTVAVMVQLYCRTHHPDADGLCAECGSLLAYAHTRLDRCPYGAGKPTCVTCPIHCYTPAPREAMRAVMRETGPKMMWRHPWLACVHLWKQLFRKAPTRAGRAQARRAGGPDAPPADGERS